MRNRHPQNLKLGIFTIIGMLIFVAAVYFIGNKQNLFGNNVRVTSVFKNVNGLQAGNNVRYSGVNVGTVKKINIVNDTSIAVDMAIDHKSFLLIKKNATAAISSDGLVGSMVINIIPGDNPGYEPIKPGDTISSISKVATADMLSTLNTTNENAALLTADLLKITNAINNGEGTVGALIKDSTMAQNIKQSLAGLRRTTHSASVTFDKLNRKIDGIDFEEGVAGVLFNDSVAAANLSEVIVNLNKSAKELEEMSRSLNEFSEEIRSGDGTLDYVINDTTFVNHLEATVRNAEAASKKFDENMEALQHNFLFRGYFRRMERRKAREQEKKNSTD
ncbi:MAG: MlaD family protein [Salinimicrobium sp.]